MLIDEIKDINRGNEFNMESKFILTINTKGIQKGEKVTIVSPLVEKLYITNGINEEIVGMDDLMLYKEPHYNTSEDLKRIIVDKLHKIENLQLHRDLLNIQNSGWKTNVYEITPLYVEIYGYKSSILSGLSTPEDLYELYIDLFDDSFEKYIGLEKPNNVWELVNILEELRKKEELGKHMHWIILDTTTNKIAGIMYFYDYKPKYGKSKITIGLAPSYRNRGLAGEILEELIRRFMGRGLENSILVRLECAVETSNLRSIALMSKLKKFRYEGLATNLYGYGNDANIYSYTL